MNPDAADYSTDEIIVAIRGGEVEAYRHIVVRYQGEVLKIVNAMLIDYSAREDVVQQVFVRTYKALDQYQLGRGFGKWIKAIARNLVREELRKKYRYRARIEAYANEVIDRLETEDASDLGHREASFLRQRALNDCLDGLEETASQAVRLHYLDRKKTEEIAEIIGKSAGAVRTLLYRARGHLRQCMESKGVLA